VTRENSFQQPAGRQAADVVWGMQVALKSSIDVQEPIYVLYDCLRILLEIIEQEEMHAAARKGIKVSR
jgi:hypothetical protein